jgi:hypothetical protein
MSIIIYNISNEFWRTGQTYLNKTSFEFFSFSTIRNVNWNYAQISPNDSNLQADSPSIYLLPIYLPVTAYVCIYYCK